MWSLKGLKIFTHASCTIINSSPLPQKCLYPSAPICSSTIYLISAVTFEGLPEPILLLIKPVVPYVQCTSSEIYRCQPWNTLHYPTVVLLLYIVARALKPRKPKKTRCFLYVEKTHRFHTSSAEWYSRRGHLFIEITVNRDCSPHSV